MQDAGIAGLLANLLAILVSAKLFGELLDGVVLGCGLFSFFRPDDPVLAEISAIIMSAVLGKVASGWAVWGPGLNRLGIGVGMVVVTTFLAPPLLKKILRDRREASP